MRQLIDLLTEIKEAVLSNYTLFKSTFLSGNVGKGKLFATQNVLANANSRESSRTVSVYQTGYMIQ